MFDFFPTLHSEGPQTSKPIKNIIKNIPQTVRKYFLQAKFSKFFFLVNACAISYDGTLVLNVGAHYDPSFLQDFFCNSGSELFSNLREVPSEKHSFPPILVAVFPKHGSLICQCMKEQLNSDSFGFSLAVCLWSNICMGFSVHLPLCEREMFVFVFLHRGFPRH